MEENLAIILNNSNKTISKLQVLSAFFDEEIIYKIYLRSQVVHKMFETNPELDINKLELFHVQYTDSVIDLLRKIKIDNEKNVSLLYDEIHLNEELIEKLNNATFTEKSYELDKQRQSLKMNLSTRALFKTLSENTDEYPFSKNINAFSNRYAPDFFYDISADQMLALINFDTDNVYKNTHATIQKKLMGLLCKVDFKTAFHCGLRSGDLAVEIYRFLDMDREYLYLPSKNLLLLCDLSTIHNIDWTNNLSKKGRILQELTSKNDLLESRAKLIKTRLPDAVKTVLSEYNEKISEVDFLQKIGNYDVQTNILRAMLNTDTL